LILLGSTGSVLAVDATSYPVTMARDANPEPDVIGYRLHDGITPGTYPNRLDAGSATTKTISPIARGTYYMIVTACNTAGLESLPSEELKVLVGSAIDTQSPMISCLPGGNRHRAGLPGRQTSVNDGANAFAQSLEGDQAVLHLFHNPYLPDVVLQVECSENLANGWYPVATRQRGKEWTAALPGLEISTGRTGNLQEVTLRDAVGNKPTAFYCLIVQRPGIE
jgi:hypothetical protein